MVRLSEDISRAVQTAIYRCVYIVDFYCYSAKLIIELDGSQHFEPKAMEYDAMRTEYLQNQNFLVLRFSNADVMAQFRAVCETIDTAVKNRMRD